MDSPNLIHSELPELSDESAGQISQFLYTFINEFEGRYDTQLRRYYQSHSIPEPPEPPEDDLFDDYDDLPPF